MKRINLDIAYILGSLRDATFDIREAKNYEIKMAQKDDEWLLWMQKLISRNFGISGKISKHINGTKILRINGKKVVQELLRISEMKIPQENWDTPNIIKQQTSNKILLNYLRGFFDAEGGLPKDPLNAKQKYICFSQKNKESLILVREILIRNKFRPTNVTFCGGVWEFRLARKNDMIKFCDVVGSSHGNKRKRLKILKSGYFPQFGGGALPGVEAAVQLDSTPGTLPAKTAE
jgi:intein-encoded DNA endonuclease-like protein